MKIYIIRHGETKANEQSLIQGTVDWPLNENGRFLAHETGKALRDIRFTRAYTSPLSRAKETAEILLSENRNEKPALISDPRIREIYMGVWENQKSEGQLSKTELYGKGNGGESLRAAMERTQGFLREIAGESGLTEEDNILIATHGGALRCMLNFLYDDPGNFWQTTVPLNCCVNLLSSDGVHFRFLERDRIYYDPKYAVDHFQGRL